MSSPTTSPARSRPVTPSHSIAAISGMINHAMASLKRLGPLVIHCQWIRPQANTGASGFLTVTLADTAKSDLAIQGFVWNRTVIATLLEEGRRFGVDLAARDARCEIVLEATIDYWMKQNKVYLNIQRLNTVGMKGLKHQQREAVIQRLTDEQLLTRNKSIRWHMPTLRVAIVSKCGSAACEDALSILHQSGLAFVPTLFHVSVQGARAEQTILHAFNEIATRAQDFDVVLLIRGGGNELDLLAYDLYSVAHAVACCPLPVITGLGHQIDQSVCDLVAYHTVVTPTAAAQLLVTRVTEILSTIATLTQRIRAEAERQYRAAQSHVLSHSSPLSQRCLTLLHQARHQTAHLMNSILYEFSRDAIHRTRRDIQTVSTSIHTTVLVAVSSRARLTYHTLLDQIRSRVREELLHTRFTIGQCAAHLDALQPERLIRLGLVFVTNAGGEVIHDPQVLQPKDRLTIQFPHHDVIATVNTIKEHFHDPRRTLPGQRPRHSREPGRRTRRT